VSVQDGKTPTTDREFAAIKEARDRFFTLQANESRSASEAASKVPALSMGGVIENWENSRRSTPGRSERDIMT
jgi:hypothetical protein